MDFHQRKTNWIFDMDGTLTIAIHDFSDIKRQLGLPQDTDILTSLSRLPPEESLEKRKQLDTIELEIAKMANPSPGCLTLLQKINVSSNHLGILTRNSFHNSVETLKATGLLDYFHKDYIFCRERAIPKPNPEGILRLMELWNAKPHETVMVGDYVYDLEAGYAAGVETVYIDPEGKFPFRESATHCIRQLDELLYL
ncbi:HAD family hydrolase [Leptospira bourretii]|uniref:HAD family hydrolase n=2 Tax=Leptospira bourretii TaxID=2484962 RepID=A0A4R9IJ28_9LEPT|nr:HAD family hydrolase [Leptospira bourretii]TGK88655.1 HAD family hydrolase [Leptospira bourretii]TGL20508.1 HAD family hydrolase [Leptospira bourretii]TGL38027.1 HAD family hydrolase [Leptospira bourretii]